MMADGKVVIDLEINDKSVDKKLNTADKKVDKFAKDVSQKEAKPNVDADAKKLEKKSMLILKIQLHVSKVL